MLPEAPEHDEPGAGGRCSWPRCWPCSGFRQDRSWLVRQYHRLLVWDIMEQPALTRVLEKCMNPIMGKSVVMYFRKEAAA